MGAVSLLHLGQSLFGLQSFVHQSIDDFEDNRSLLSSGLNTYWNGAHRYLEKYLIGAGRKCVVWLIGDSLQQLIH